jgi:basic membrane lipoprotein Med (substrate-binding protein (PBP1-ABC) superfamily)
MRKRVDIGVFMTAQDAFLGGLTGEVKRYGLSDRAVDYLVDQHNQALLPKAVIDRVNDIAEQIIDGKIQVPEKR